MLVWACSRDWFSLYAAPTRGKARWEAHCDNSEGDVLDLLGMSVRRVLANGDIGGRGEQATVEATAPRELTTAECAALGWRMCSRCDEVLTHEDDGLCECCHDEAQDEADQAMDLAHGEARP